MVQLVHAYMCLDIMVPWVHLISDRSSVFLAEPISAAPHPETTLALVGGHEWSPLQPLPSCLTKTSRRVLRRPVLLHSGVTTVRLLFGRRETHCQSPHTVSFPLLPGSHETTESSKRCGHAQDLLNAAPHAQLQGGASFAVLVHLLRQAQH